MHLFLLAGCELVGGTPTDAGEWIDQSPSCDADPYAWSNDLVSFLQAGAGDGSFDLDPADDPRSGVSGSYDADSGEFAYDVRYAEGYFLVDASVQDGLGTAWHNGDLDVQYVYNVEDKLESKVKTALRVERIGCKEVRWAWDPEADEPVYTELSGEYSSDGFAWSQPVEGADYAGTLQPDGTSVEVYEADDNGYDETLVTHPDGTVDREFRIKDNPYVYEGTGLQAFDGSSSSSYQISEDGEVLCEVRTEYQYDGDGDEEWECGDESFSCETDVDDEGKCTYECDDGQSGRC